MYVDVITYFPDSCGLHFNQIIQIRKAIKYLIKCNYEISLILFVEFCNFNSDILILKYLKRHSLNHTLSFAIGSVFRFVMIFSLRCINYDFDQRMKILFKWKGYAYTPLFENHSFLYFRIPTFRFLIKEFRAEMRP